MGTTPSSARTTGPVYVRDRDDPAGESGTWTFPIDQIWHNVAGEVRCISRTRYGPAGG